MSALAGGPHHRVMLATHTGIYDQLLLFLAAMAVLAASVAVMAARLLRRPDRAAGAGVALLALALVLVGLAAGAPSYARYRNRCVEHHSDIPLCSRNGISVPPVPVSDWAAPPPPADFPAAAPDDPSAYRGLRVRLGFGPAGSVAGGAPRPWLVFAGGSLTGADPAAGGPFYGTQTVSDGRREMYWFTRVDDMPENTAAASFDVEHVVLDVLVRPDAPTGTRLVEGCAGEGTVTLAERDGSDVLAAWQFDRRAGRVVELEPHGIRCPRSS